MALASEFESSGLTRSQFSERHGVAPSTLSRYLQRHRAGGDSGDRAWVEVEVAPLQPSYRSELTLCLSSGERIEVPAGFDPETLHQLLRVLGGR